MLHDSLNQLRDIADNDVPRETAQQLINSLNEVIGKVKAHDPNGSSTNLGDAITALAAAISSTEEALAAMSTGADHINDAANNV